MPIKNKIFAIIFVSLFSGLSANASLCNNTYYPVCGENGITYQNACLLKEAGETMQKFGSCEVNTTSQNEEIDLTKSSATSQTQNRINVFFDNYFSNKNRTLEKKVIFINNLLSQVSSVKNVSEDKKEEVKNALLNYRNNLIAENSTISNTNEEESSNSNEENINNNAGETSSDEEVNEEDEKQNNDENSEDNNENDNKEINPENKYITENTADNVDNLRINYIKDNIGVRALGGARITAFNIIGKSENSETGITDNYTIIVSEEYYEDDDGNIHVGIQTITPAVIQTKATEETYEIIGHILPRGGNLYRGDIEEMFPEGFADKLQKDSDYFQEKVAELQEINLENATKYFENN